MKKIIPALLIFQTLCNISYAQSGTLDLTFGIGGIVTTSFGGNSEGRSVAIQTDGKILVAGNTDNGSMSDGDVEFAIVRYNMDGTLDNTFDSDGKVSTNFGTGSDGISAIAVQSDGKIVVAGGSNGDFAVARYDSSGILDNTFDADGKVTTTFGGSNDGAGSVAIQGDGKIIVSGTSNSGTSYDLAIVRYNSDGSLDNSFGTGGKVTTDLGGEVDLGSSVVLQTDGKIVVAGSSTDFISNIDFVTVRYNSDGSLDNTFGAGGMVITDFGGTADYSSSAAIQTDGKILAAGRSGDDFALARYNNDGSLDTTFDADGKVTTSIGSYYSYGYSVLIQADNKIIVAGTTNPTGSSLDGDFALIRYNSNGSLDNTFGLGGIAITDFGRADMGTSATIQSDGKIVVAGSSQQPALGTIAVARYYNVIFSGLEESVNNNEPDVKIYPNPSLGIFTVSLKNKTVKTEICIHDVLGNCILDKVNVKNSDQKIDLSSQAKGIYFMEIVAGDERAVKKIILE